MKSTFVGALKCCLKQEAKVTGTDGDKGERDIPRTYCRGEHIRSNINPIFATSDNWDSQDCWYRIRSGQRRHAPALIDIASMGSGRGLHNEQLGGIIETILYEVASRIARGIETSGYEVAIQQELMVTLS
ncbi:hypothetical protein CIHG_09679 [Coccidioides immitis H538.4]|nr:hypothetical protein CIRG_09675 [Coccidioides immitis RMSCC 2394]KMU76872.1 hypothetical protein CISG_05914 [Coccidioides immitis RMSCC 3703]KMU91898.1 hypothetical protein CIHG_09679 [Coccidioides immitis H538.4]